MIRNLLYVTATRPDVMQDAGLVARFESAPKETHVTIVKIIFRYLKHTVDYGLWYPKCQVFTLKAFTYAYWGESVDDRKWSNILFGQLFCIMVKQKTILHSTIYNKG